MANIAFGFPNKADSGSLSGGSWGSTLANLQTRDWSQKARSTALALSDTKIIVNCGASTAVRLVALPGWNLSATAQIRVSLGTTGGANDVYAGSWASAWQASYSASLRRPPAVLIPSGYSAAYVLVEIDDGSNAAGYVEGSRLVVCPIVQPEHGAVYGRRQGHADLSASVRLESGARHVFAGEKPRRVRFDVKAIRRSTEYETVRDLLLIAGVSEPVYYLPNLVPADVQRDGFLGTIVSADDVTDDHYGYCSVGVEMEESL